MKRSNYNCRPHKDPTYHQSIKNIENVDSSVITEDEFNHRNRILNNKLKEMKLYFGEEYDLIELKIFDKRTHKYVTRKF